MPHSNAQSFHTTLIIYHSGDITAIDETKSFEFYVLRGDLTVNPIPERAPDMRAQAVNEDGLCAFDIPAYTDTDGFLDAVVSSVSGADCSFSVCRTAGCHKCIEDGGEAICTPCDASSDCDATEGEALEYRYCPNNCDAVVTVNENNEFALLTGKKFPQELSASTQWEPFLR